MEPQLPSPREEEEEEDEDEEEEGRTEEGVGESPPEEVNLTRKQPLRERK